MASNAPWEDWQAGNAAPWEEWQQPATPNPQAPAQPYDWNSESWAERLGQVTPFRQIKELGHAAYNAAIGPGEALAGNMPMWQGEHTSPQAIQYGANTALLASPAPPRVAASLAATGLAPTAAALETSYKAGYKDLKPGGPAYAEYNPQAVAGNAAAIKQYLESENFRGRRAPATHEELAGIATVPSEAGATPLATIHDLQYHKQLFNDIVSDPEQFSKTERAAAGIAKQRINEFIQNPPAGSVMAGNPELAASTLSAADKNFAAKARSDLITGTQELAEGRAAQANSGQNLGNKIRSGAGKILDSPSLSYGFTPEELAMLEKVRFGSVPENTKRYIGNLLGGGGGLGGFVTGAAGSWYSPFLAPLPLVGTALKKSADRSTLKNFQAVDEATRMRSALGEALMNGSRAPNSLQAIDPKRALLIKALMTPQEQQ